MTQILPPTPPCMLPPTPMQRRIYLGFLLATAIALAAINVHHPAPAPLSCRADTHYG